MGYNITSNYVANFYGVNNAENTGTATSYSFNSGVPAIMSGMEDIYATMATNVSPNQYVYNYDRNGFVTSAYDSNSGATTLCDKGRATGTYSQDGTLLTEYSYDSNGFLTNTKDCTSGSTTFYTNLGTCPTMTVSQDGVPLSFYNYNANGTPAGTTVYENGTEALTKFSSGETTSACGSFFDSLKISKPSVESIKEMYKGLDEKSLKGLTEEEKVDKYCEAWMKAQGFDSKQYAAIKKQYAPQREQMEKLKKEITVKYADKLEDKNASVDVYYEMMIDMQNPDMDPKAKTKLINQLKKDYNKQQKEMKKLGKEIEKELGDNPTTSDYFKMMLKRQDPELAKPENAKKLQEMADNFANSEDFKEMYEFYEEVGDVFGGSESGVSTMIESAEHFVGKGTNASHGKDLDGQYETITERMEISQASGVNSKDEKWDVGFAVNQMSGSGVLDISSAFVKNKDGEYKAKYDLTKYNDLVKWSKKENVWRDSHGDYKPKAGDAVMFDEKHMGIIYKVEGDKIYTIEGGLTGKDPSGKYKGEGSYVGKRSYDLGNEHIVGFIACTEPEKKKS